MTDYSEFLARKSLSVKMGGIEPSSMPSFMKPHQVDATSFALRAGRAGNFLDTGLGKTLCELEFAAQAARAANGQALILTPLAVAKQIEREAAKFGYDANVIREQKEAKSLISICNYDRLEKIDPSAFAVIVLDESSILKSFTGATSRALRDTFSQHRFRLSATATPAPNDHMELGQHAEYLGVMNSVEMLSKFFINDTSTASQQWRLKGHAEESFWNWMASWAVMAESPADLGHDASEYVLPALKIIKHAASGSATMPMDGLFSTVASATNIHEIKRATIDARADEVADAVGQEDMPWVIWCDTNYEADALKIRIKDAVEVRGAMSIEEKEESLEAFASGQVRNIITKPSIAGFGCNWQHCSRMAFVGRSFSYETWYQAVRRCWRFGQKNDVAVHLAVAEGEDQISRVIERKSADHIRMKRLMGAAMRRALGRESLTKIGYEPKHYAEIPEWLTAS